MFAQASSAAVWGSCPLSLGVSGSARRACAGCDCRSGFQLGGVRDTVAVAPEDAPGAVRAAPRARRARVLGSWTCSGW
jgi:hypothetical protein